MGVQNVVNHAYRWNVKEHVVRVLELEETQLTIFGPQMVIFLLTGTVHEGLSGCPVVHVKHTVGFLVAP